MGLERDVRMKIENRQTACHRIFHIHASIDGLLAQKDSYLQQIASSFTIDGKVCRTAADVREGLKNAKADGWEIIPAKGCDNYDKKTGCLGHVIQDEREP